MAAKAKKLIKQQTTRTHILFGNHATPFTESQLGAALHFVLAERKNNPVLEIPGSEMQYICTPKQASQRNKALENAREAGAALAAILQKRKTEVVFVNDKQEDADLFLAFIEGLLLASYRFDKYKTDKKNNILDELQIDTPVKESRLKELLSVIEATIIARDWVNETPTYLDSVVFARELQKTAKEAGLKCEVFDKKKIEALKMGGILGVNRGSVVPPTFTILEWKPKKHNNKKPIVLVGKGIVYDTGGLDIKTGGSMATMKCDMAGAAGVAGAMLAIAKNQLPVHIIALVPATDNRPGGHAYGAGDVLVMHNGKTVEVLNTDAEGRLILADALSYAQRYKPELVIDMATLTGAALRAIGSVGSVGMGNAEKKTMEALKEAGEETYERIAEMPFWDEYGEMVKSEVADIRNSAGPLAGAITAGKFLEHFTDYPWIHLDIAGPSFLDKPSHYRPAGGTGIGVRLLYTFVKNQYC